MPGAEESRGGHFAQEPDQRGFDLDRAGKMTKMPSKGRTFEDASGGPPPGIAACRGAATPAAGRGGPHGLLGGGAIGNGSMIRAGRQGGCGSRGLAGIAAALLWPFLGSTAASAAAVAAAATLAAAPGPPAPPAKPAASASASAAAPDRATGRAITIVSWGGSYERSQVKAYFEPFTKKTGIRIDVEKYDGGLAELRRQAARRDDAWDLMDMTMADNRAACRQGLLEPIDHSLLLPAPDGTPAFEDFIDGALTECGIGQIVYAVVAAYNRDAFPGERPARMRDIFDIRRFPGKRALQRSPEANLEWALASYGVPREDLYQLLSTGRGLRLAFERLDSIRDHTVWWTDTGQPVELLTTGKAVIASHYNGRLFDAATVHGHPIEIIWDAQVYELGAWGIPKGTPRLDEVLEFVRFATGTRPLAEQARYIPYGPARESSMKLVTTHAETGVDMRPHLPTSPVNFRTAILKDTEWYASLYDRIEARFDAWLEESGSPAERGSLGE